MVHITEKGRTCLVLERLDDISAVCSHCGIMVQDYVTCMFMVVELWTEF
jgi:hypothetical protein